ncbi:MAG TPA: hypothetical protein VFE20_01410, partial [Thermoleophilia bacterium]|nr:hypothetical protein [Thermoleophilia bacterium]
GRLAARSAPSNRRQVRLGYTEAEDALLLTLVAEHGRADGLRQFVVQNGHRTQYGAECRLYRLTRKAAK